MANPDEFSGPESAFSPARRHTVDELTERCRLLQRISTEARTRAVLLGLRTARALRASDAAVAQAGEALYGPRGGTNESG